MAVLFDWNGDGGYTEEQPAGMSKRAEKPVAVLVVDDDDQIRQTLRWVLEDAGYPMLEAPDGAAALDMVRRDPRRLIVLLDVLMPRLDGFGVLRTVAANPALAKHRVYVLLSAQGRAIPPDLRHVLFAVVPKPFDLAELLDTLEAAAAALRRA